MPENITSESRESVNAEVVRQFRAGGGAVGGSLADIPLLLLHHIGAKSGQPRVTPLAVSLHLGDRLVIIASNAGADNHPSWYYNLKTNHIATVELGSEVFRMSADELHGTDRDEIWDRIIANTSSPAAYQAATDRLIPVLALTKCPNVEETPAPDRKFAQKHNPRNRGRKIGQPVTRP